MIPDIIIRSFEKSDREAVRRICCDSADQGKPIEGFFDDRECAADLLTGYYTDHEPSSTFVAVDQGKVIGYTQGCMNNRRYGLIMFWILIPKIILKAFLRGVFFRKEIWQIAFAMGQNWRRLFAWRKESFHSHEAHVHIGIDREYRGKHVGERLIAAFLQYAQTRGAKEITASVHSGNAGACRFFEHLGFQVKQRYPMVMARGNSFEFYSYQSLVYVKKISS